MRLFDTAGRIRARVRGRRPGATPPAGDGVRISYAPERDGLPDAGEVVWTWVPYEDDPSQGKDRPVVVIGSLAGGLAVVPLSSRDHADRRDHGEWVRVGTGPWDGAGRDSYANVDRVVRVDAGAVRREGATLDRGRFDAVVAGVRRHHPEIA
ncbi:MAG TPA: type II toxin-antitoxin system PemK/MazF family toxin [Acidimicrobiales bacterium]